ncbi:hypothetical protein HK405_010117 [Cladochytrium tenue]|nr:hypothetical protein HK405_010117 [Cladochytrium tenue]
MQARSVHDLFLSYRVACDLAFVDAVYDLCSSAATASRATFHAYLDHRCLVPGRPWEDGFLRGLNSAPVVFLVISPASARSLHCDHDNVVLEWEFAVDRLDAGRCAAVVPLFVDYYSRDDLQEGKAAHSSSFSAAAFGEMVASFPDTLHDHPRSPRCRTLRGMLEYVASMHSITVSTQKAPKPAAPTTTTDGATAEPDTVDGARSKNRGSPAPLTGKPAVLYLFSHEQTALNQLLLPEPPSWLPLDSQLILEPCPIPLASELYQWVEDPNSQVLMVDDTSSNGHPLLSIWLETSLLRADILVATIHLTRNATDDVHDCIQPHAHSDPQSASNAANLAVRQIILGAAAFAPEFGRSLLARTQPSQSLADSDLDDALLVEALASCVSAAAPATTEPSRSTPATGPVVVVLRLADAAAEASRAVVREVMAKLHPSLRAVQDCKILWIRSVASDTGATTTGAAAAAATTAADDELHRGEQSGDSVTLGAGVAVARLFVDDIMAVARAADQPVDETPPVIPALQPRPTAEASTEAMTMMVAAPGPPPLPVSPLVTTEVGNAARKDIKSLDFVICFGAECDTSIAHSLFRSFASFTTTEDAVYIQPFEQDDLAIAAKGSSTNQDGRAKPVYLFLLSNPALEAMRKGEGVFLKQV